MTIRLLLFAIVLTLLASALSGSEASLGADSLKWHADYGSAYAAAKQQKKMLLIHFAAKKDDKFDQEFQATIATPEIAELLQTFTLVRLPVAYEVTIDGEAMGLLGHPAFAALGENAGLALIDLRDEESDHYGHTVSAVPFQQIGYYAPSPASVSAVRTLLHLPAGSITQRSMIYAVRLHPEKPASTNGSAEPYLFSEAAGHSAYMARTGVQGHQGFDSRFQRIVSKLGMGGAKEVCAESWPGEAMLPACFSCVHSWRQSQGHWEGVSGTHSAYGYDIRRGASGIWYATGLFAGW